jgi:hypothetical protein
MLVSAASSDPAKLVLAVEWAFEPPGWVGAGGDGRRRRMLPARLLFVIA